MRNELERVSPAQVGLSPDAILRYVESLERCGTEMHGIMIARHGKVCAEGWWQPYSPLLRHGLQSLTKSYTVTAVGLAADEGKLRLDEKLVDILPEYMPQNSSENLRKLTVRDLMCMGSGMEEMQDRTKPTWVSDFFSSKFINKPGSKFYYSGVVTSILGVVVKKKTGQGLMDYLTPRVFDKIGIDSENLKWIVHPDGYEYGGGGLFATTEDNLRLGLLYLNGGMWAGERILSDEWVRAASHKQIDTPNEGAADNVVGYGYQMWMCQPEGVFRFDGAAGQFVIVVPSLDMVISINQGAFGRISQETLNITWKYLREAEGAGGSEVELKRKLQALALPRVWPAAPADASWPVDGSSYTLEPNQILLMPGDYTILSHKVPRGIEKVGFEQGEGELIVTFRYGGRDCVLHACTDGVNRLSRFPIAPDLPDMIYATARQTPEGKLELELRYIETCFVVHLFVRHERDFIEISTIVPPSPLTPGGPITARSIRP